MKKSCLYLKADLKRLFCSARPILAVLLTVGALLLAALEGIDWDAGVLYVFSLVMYGMPSMMILVCAAAAFADSFCEDMEHKYLMQQLLRGSAGSYLSARMLSIFLAALFTTAMGILLFVNILHLHLPWVGESGVEQYENLLLSGRLKGLLESQSFELYFLCYGMQYGVLSGILSLWAAYLSLFISNRMLVLASPMILYYFTDYLLAEIFSGKVNLGLIFSPSGSLFSEDLPAVLLVAAVAMMNFMLLGRLIAWKISPAKKCK